MDENQITEAQEDNAALHANEVKRRSIQGVLVIAVKTFFIFGLTLIAQGILGAALSPAEFGIYGFVVTVTNFFTIISDIGLASSLIQKKEAPTTQELRTVFTVQQLLSWIVCVLLIGSALLLKQYGKLSMEGVLLAAAFGLSFPIVSVKTISSILLERELDFGKLVITAIIETVVFYALTVYLALNHFGIMSYTYAVIAKAVVGVIVMLSFKRWKMGYAFSRKSFFALMSVGGQFQLNDMLAKVKDDVFYITVGLVVPSTQFGYITWAKQWSRMPYTFSVDNVSPVLFPSFSRLQHDTAALKKAIEKTVFFITLLAFPLFAGLSSMAYPLIRLIPHYAKWEPALFSLILFCFSLAFSSFSTPLVSALQAIGKVNKTLKMMVFWTVSQWAIFPIVFYYFGYNSVAIVGAILAITSFAVVWLLQQDVSFQFFENIWRQALASIVMIAVLYLGQAYWSQSILNFSEGVILGGVVFIAMMSILGFEKTKGEILSVLKRK